MNLRVCKHCQNHYRPSLSSQCPHCLEKPHAKRLSIGWLLGIGLGLAACEEDQEDTSHEDTSHQEPSAEPTAEPSDEALYGVPNNG